MATRRYWLYVMGVVILTINVLSGTNTLSSLTINWPSFSVTKLISGTGLADTVFIFVININNKMTIIWIVYCLIVIV